MRVRGGALRVANGIQLQERAFQFDRENDLVGAVASLEEGEDGALLRIEEEADLILGQQRLPGR